MFFIHTFEEPNVPPIIWINPQIIILFGQISFHLLNYSHWLVLSTLPRIHDFYLILAKFNVLTHHLFFRDSLWFSLFFIFWFFLLLVGTQLNGF